MLILQMLINELNYVVTLYQVVALVTIFHVCAWLKNKMCRLLS